jgi:predicted NUDIX family phosphoesterase
MDRVQLKQKYGDEQVLIVPASLIAHLPSGVQTAANLTELLAGAYFVPRWQAEYNPTLRQLIPYAVLRQGECLFLVQRTRRQGEARLHNLYSVGLGGHINPLDDTGQPPISAGLQRELEEELNLHGWQLADPHCAALINDLSNEVSQDHLGVLYLLDVPAQQPISVRETDKMSGQWVRLAQIQQEHFAQLESWSQLVVEFLAQGQKAES